ncbi:MAG: hypothetical protein IJ218_02375 [Alphaproteobacteria bacterium]|nr:hypothetical protein [Alphaproteobacteria bacterium]
MNIDAQIRNILTKSFPVNDNKPEATQTKEQTIALPVNNGIYVVGNNNIVIHTSLLLLASIMFCLGSIILLQH